MPCGESRTMTALYPLPTRSLRSLLEEGGLAPTKQLRAHGEKVRRDPDQRDEEPQREQASRSLGGDDPAAVLDDDEQKDR